MRRLSTTWNRETIEKNRGTSLKATATSSSESSGQLPSSRRRFSRRISLTSKRMNSSRDDKMKYNLQVQALLYILAFTIVYLFSFINRIFVQVTGSVPYYLLFIARTINPLQGFFNMIIYTRIHVSELRSKSNLPWIRAIWTVLRCKENQFGSTQNNTANGRSNRQYRRSSLQIQMKNVIQQIDDDQYDDGENDEEMININFDQVHKVSFPLQYDEHSNNNCNTKENPVNLCDKEEEDEDNDEKPGEEKIKTNEMIECQSSVYILDEVETNSDNSDNV